MKQKAIFFDRDGTINVEKGYLYKTEEFEFIEGAVEALRMAQNAGYKLIIITNQSGIARGYYTEEEFLELNKWMMETLAGKGVRIERVYYCPHYPHAKIKEYSIDCNCRKPKRGLYMQAISDFDLDISACYVIGDKIRDCSICEKGGCKGFLIAENEKDDVIEAVKAGKVCNVDYAKNLLEAVKKIFL